MRTKRAVFALLGLLVSAGLVTGLLASLDLQRLVEVVRRMDRTWLLIALAVTSVQPLCLSLRWLGVLRAQADIRAGFFLALRANLLAVVFNSFLPAKGGDALKALYLRRQCGYARGLGSVIVERLVDFFILGLLGAIGGLVSGLLWGAVIGVLLMTAVAAGAAGACLIPWRRFGFLPQSLSTGLGEVGEVLTSWMRDPVAVLMTFLGSLCNWSSGGLLIACLCVAVGQPLGVAIPLAYYPIAVMAGLVPLTVSGIGTRDSVFVLLLAPHMGPEEAALVALGYTAYVYWGLALLGSPAALGEGIRLLRCRRASSEGELAVANSSTKSCDSAASLAR